jgi:hypothetical protein
MVDEMEEPLGQEIPNGSGNEVSLDGEAGRINKNPVKNQPVVSDGHDTAPPCFDLQAIAEYVQMRHALAAGLIGKFILLVFDPNANKGTPPRFNGHYGVGEMERMWRHIAAFCPLHGVRGDERLNIYCPWALFHPGIPNHGAGSGGREADVVYSFAAVADLDVDKGDSATLSVEASCRLETSPGNFQDFFVFPQPIPFALAKKTALALHRLTSKEDDPSKRGDSTTKDVSHIWRIPGTLNWPDAVKIARGRDPAPFLVRWARYPGNCVNPQTIIDAAPPEPEKLRSTNPPPRYNTFEARKLKAALDALDPDALPVLDPPSTLYAYWLEVGMGIHALDWGDAGLAIWDAWSQRSGHYDFEELEAKWLTFGEHSSSRTVGSIFHWAMGEGAKLLKRKKPVSRFIKRGGRHAR